MKKILLLLLVLSMALFMAGCGNQQEVEPEVTATPTPAPTATPEPTIAPTPVPVVALADYQYFIVTNSTLAVSFKYPSHWVNEPGKASIRYTEPVNAGETPAQLTVTSKVVSERPGSRGMEKQLENFLTIVEQKVSGFEKGELKEDVQILESDGLRQKYTARDPKTDEPITGYVLMAYVKSVKRIYLLHFTAPSDRYDEMSSIIDVIRESMTTT